MQTASNRAPHLHADKGGGWAGEEEGAPPPSLDVVDQLNDRTRQLLEEEEDEETEHVD